MRLTLLALTVSVSPITLTAEPITVDVWADNWFALYIDGKQVLTDSVPITTERSFNKETAELDIAFPAQIAILAKDFKENDTGLEYIGTRRQQMGDGGLIAQFTDGSGRVIGVTSNAMKCLAAHHAPVDARCARARDPQVGQGPCASETTAEPAGWTSAAFDDSAWPQATEHSAREVRPKDGYDRVRWDRAAKIIWTESLTQDNTILCRMTLNK